MALVVVCGTGGGVRHWWLCAALVVVCGTGGGVRHWWWCVGVRHCMVVV